MSWRAQRGVRPVAAGAARLSSVLGVGVERGTLLGSAPVGATQRKNETQHGTFVTVLATGGEIAEEVAGATRVVRASIKGKPIGSFRDSGSVRVQSTTEGVKFSVTLRFEHGGSKALLDGNVGGAYFKHKLDTEQRNNDDWGASTIATLFAKANGSNDDGVKITYMYRTD